MTVFVTLSVVLGVVVTVLSAAVLVILDSAGHNDVSRHAPSLERHSSPQVPA